ncbi:MAG: DUF4394 domain-containing protein [Planctomycetota bacterium]|nr:DUF4394 domain-containing protein [Planctomycetota bacterium]
MKHVTLIAGMVLCGAGAPAMAELVYGVTLTQTLVSWDSAAPGTILSGAPVQGLAPNETVQGLDLRPATGELFALGSFSNLYRVNPANGQATFVAPLSASLNGSSFGFDFNPTVDRIRTVSDADQNLRSVPSTGVTTVDGTLAFAAGDVNAGVNPNVVGAAYTNNFMTGAGTQLFVVDAGLDALLLQNPANSGQLTTIGSLGTDITDLSTFDISGNTGVAYMSIRDMNLSRSTFWTVNLSTGAGMMVGEVGGGSIITAMTVVPAPASAALLGLGMAAALRRRR